MNTLISVLLPLYNEPLEYAKSAIDSILKQSFKNIELILLLDNPNNLELLSVIKDFQEQDKRVRTHVNEKNLGLPETLNKGIELSIGEYIARMDGDAISHLSRLETQLRFLQKNKHIDLIGSDAYIIDENDNIIGGYHKLRTDFSHKMMLCFCTINLIHPTWMGKKEVFEKVLYRNFMYCEDYDFMLRAYALGFRFYNLQEKLFYYRISHNSLQSVSRKFAYEQYVNNLRARKQFAQFRHSKDINYPELPILTYDIADKEKYQSTIHLLNKLRMSIDNKYIIRSCILFFNIIKIDVRPITFRLRNKLFFHLLKFTELFH